MKFLFYIFFISFLGGFFGAPFLNKYYVKYDFIILPQNIYLKKSPIVRSIDGLKVKFVRGKVIALKNQNPVELKINDQVDSGDMIYVRDNSWLVLEFGFGSRIKANSNTLIKVDDLKKDLGQFDYSKVNTFVLKSGSLYVDHLGYAEDVSLRIKAKKTSMGIRGTNFIAAIGDNDLALRVAVEHGKVDLENMNNETLPVAAGEGAVASYKGSFSEAKAHRWVSQINWELEHNSFENPENYEKDLDSKLKEIVAKKKADIEAIKNFKPTENAITNDNLEQKLNEENAAPEDAKEAETASASQTETGVDKTTIQNANEAFDAEDDMKDVDLNFTRFSKKLPKINKVILDKFVQMGLVPDDLKIAKETIFEAERLMEKRAQELDQIDEE